MKINSLSELRELLQLLAEQDIASFQSGDLHISRNSKSSGLVQLQLDAKEYSKGDLAQQETEEDDLLFYSADGGRN